ncbi:MAG: metallophosphoesterase [Nitrospirae bacterium]|nr:metallophosphoesterase [Nitrospirota bacterium]
MLRICRCTFILVLVNIFLICGCGGGTSSANKNFPVVVFSDIHFNPFYDPSLFEALNAADVGQWESIFRTSSLTGPSPWGSDTNYPLLTLALSSIKQNLGASPLIIFTGDILGHGLPIQFYEMTGGSPLNPADVAAMKAFLRKTAAFVMQQVRASVGNIPVMFVLGNSDSYSVIEPPDSSFFSDTAELYYTEFVSGAADHQAFITNFTNGGYYAAEPAGINVMVIGLNTYEFSPLFNDKYADAVSAQLNWLDITLNSARAKGKKVWLLMHVPPGADKYSTAQSVDSNGHIATATMMWNQDYQTSLLQILSKYPGLITHTLTAHTHMDEYRIMSPGNVAMTTPSIAPYFGNNPAFKVFTFSLATSKATDYTSLNYDLATTPEQFNRYYTFSMAYLMEGYLNDSLLQLYPELAAETVKQQLYRGNYFSGHNYIIPVGNEFSPITDKTWPVYWCGIDHMDKQGLIDCVNSY